MSLLVFVEDLLGAIIQLVDYLQHLFIDQTCGLFAVRLLETILAVVVVAYVGELVAHTIISHHAKGSLRGTLQIIHGSRRDMTREELFGGTSS